MAISAGKIIDRIVSVFSPESGFKRTALREALEKRNNSTDFSILQSGRMRSDYAWSLPSTTPDADYSDVDVVRSRSRDLYHNDGRAHGVIESMVTQVVGTGIRPQSRLPYEYLNISPEDGNTLENKLEFLWDQFTKECDITGQQDFYSIQQTAYRNKKLNGEYLIVITSDTKSDGMFNLKLQCIDSERLQTPNDLNSDKSIKNGIKYDEIGTPLGYYITNTYDRNSKYTYIPRLNKAGMVQVIHDFDIVRWGQSRGIPVFNTVLREFKGMSSYREAELLGVSLAACVGLYIKDGDNSPLGVQSGTTGQVEEELRPGMIIHGTGEMKQIDSSRPGNNYSNFLEDIDHSIAQAMNVPYEIIHNRYTAGSYSSIRAAMLSARRFFGQEQNSMIAALCMPVWNRFVSECFVRGYVVMPDYVDQKHLYRMSRWVPQGYDWVDPTKEAQATEIMLRLGLTTYQDEIAKKTGGDWLEVFNQLAIERDYMKERGLVPEDAPTELPTNINELKPDDEPEDEDDPSTTIQSS